VRRHKAVFILIAALVGILLWLVLRPSSEDRMAEFVAELRARGEPVTLADMDSTMPSDQENGAWRPWDPRTR